MFGLLGSLKQSETCSDQVITNRAADTTVGKVDGLALDSYDELCVDVDGPEVIDENGGADAIVRTQDVVENRGLPGPEKSADDGDWDCHGPRRRCYFQKGRG